MPAGWVSHDNAARQFDAGFPIPPSKPGVQLSLHPAFHLLIRLSLLLVARDAQRPQVRCGVGIFAPFEARVGPLVIDLRLVQANRLPTLLAAVTVPLQNCESEVHPAAPVVDPGPRSGVEQFLPPIRSPDQVRVEFVRLKR